MSKKVQVKVERIEKREGYYNVRYRYADVRLSDAPFRRLYGARQYGAVDELDAFKGFIKCMNQVNYEVVTQEQ